ncbi:PREDICTED: cell wall protein IFF6-like [Branchiostoma belcheri]|uniref:Cell wall protein IFF6-like n=1 Tax=Branchiostoma belcheri TaxID=7741 RepID=A0A6P5A719_BRABE|nr:PREDICTED: cell wall protein IFF6-like [Branchiostoma belcheri]
MAPFKQSTTPTTDSNHGWSTVSSSAFNPSAKSTSKPPTLSPTPSTTPTADSNPGWSTVSSSPFNPSAKSTSKPPTLFPTSSTTPTADSNPGWSTVSSSPFNPSSNSTSKSPTLSPTSSTTPTADSNTNWSTVSTEFPFGFRSTRVESNTGLANGGILMSVPLLATLCVFLGLFSICTIVFTARCMYKRRHRDPTPLKSSTNTNVTDKLNAHEQIRLQGLITNAGINIESKTPHHDTEDSKHIYNLPTNDDPDQAEYDTIGAVNQSESPHHGAGQLDSFGYLVLPPSLPPRSENQTDYQADSQIKPADAASRRIGGCDTLTDETEYDDGARNRQSLDSFGYLVLPPSLPPMTENQTGYQADSQIESADPATRTIGGCDTLTDETEYDDVLSQSQKSQPESEQMQDLGNLNDGYEVPSLSLCPGEGPQSHKHEDSRVTAAAKDAASDPQVMTYENDSGYEVPSLSLCPGEDPQSHKHEDSHMTAAAKDAAADPQVMTYENDSGYEVPSLSLCPGEGQQSQKHENSSC